MRETEARDNDLTTAGLAHADRAAAAVDEAVDAALGHARNALTERVRTATPGRPRLARIRAGRSRKAAVRRLLELAPVLTEHVEGSRRAAYHVAHGHWRESVPVGYQARPGAPPTREGADSAAKAVLFGIPLETQMRHAVAHHARSLSAALHEAARHGPGRLDRWADRARNSLSKSTYRAIVSGTAHADLHAMYEVMDPIYIDRYIESAQP